MKGPIEIKLNYDALIAMLQGKDFHIKTPDVHIILRNPSDGMYLTHEQINDMLYRDKAAIFSLISELEEAKKFEQKT